MEQADVDALISADRLCDFTRVPRNDEQREAVKAKMAAGGNSWLPYDNGYRPTAKEVNEWNKIGFGHDSCNQWVCVKAKAKRLGIYGECSICKGNGHYWCDDRYEDLWNNWQRIEPPAGDGWQVWETVSEGSPVTPVYSSAKELIEHLTAKGDIWDQKRGDGGWPKEAAENFVNNTGWAPSLICSSRGVQSGVEGMVDTQPRKKEPPHDL